MPADQTLAMAGGLLAVGLAAGGLAAGGWGAAGAFAASTGALRGGTAATSSGLGSTQQAPAGQRGAGEGPRPRPPAGAAAIAAGAAALGAAALGAAADARRPRTRAAKARGNPVAVRDGASWGSTTYEASTSVDTSGTLPFVRLTRGSDEATVYLLGATVTSYKTKGVEWLAVRPDAKLDGSKPISGGLPFCFPQFGPGEIQQHGFARNLPWRLLEDPSEAGVAVFELTDTEETRAMWPHAFRCEYRVELQDGQLATTFVVQNTSNSDFSFTGALHSYYSTFNVSACKITGQFQGATKIDKTAEPVATTKGTSNDIVIDKFTEEIYSEVLPGSVTLTDPSKGALDIVSGGGWRDVVIWNPYGDTAMGADGFVCVESAELAPVLLAPGANWEATMNLVPKPAS